MKTIEDAKTAKNTLKKQIGRPSYLSGIGICKDSEGYFIKINICQINLSIIKELALIPSQINNVRIDVATVGDIIALKGINNES